MEQEPINPIRIEKVGKDIFEEHRKKILTIERELIENSSSAYLIDEEDEWDFMIDALKKGGYAYLALENEEVIGFMVMGPLDDGTDLPKVITKNYPVQNCLHIKMMYIGQTGKNIGGQMMEKLIHELDKNQWKYLFVRTWVDPPNEGAIRFYTNKCGFEIIPDAIKNKT